MDEQPPSTGRTERSAVEALKTFGLMAFGLMALIVLKESASEIPEGLFGIVGGVIGYFTARATGK